MRFHVIRFTMKNFAVHTFFILALNTLVFGQESKLLIGIEGGPNKSTLNFTNIQVDYAGNPMIQLNPISSYSVGYFFQYNFSKHLSLRTNVSFERKGSLRFFELNQKFGPTAFYKLDYLVVPLLFRATWGKKINFFVNAGPYLGLLLQEMTVTEEKNNGTPQERYDGTFFYKSFDYGISAGLGLSFPIGKNFKISTEIRNNTGLSNIIYDETYDLWYESWFPSHLFWSSYEENHTIKTRSLSFLVGFAYLLGQSEEKKGIKSSN